MSSGDLRGGTSNVIDGADVVVFDFDDTLIESRGDRSGLLMDALRSWGGAVQESRLPQLWGLPFRSMVAGLSERADADYDKFVAHYVRLLEQRPPRPRPGLLETLKEVSLLTRIFVHSSSDSRLVRVDLESLKALRYIDFVCGSDWQSEPKPSSRSLDPIRFILGNERELTGIYVGDSVGDARTAFESGLTFVGVVWSAADRQAFLDSGLRDIVMVSDLREVARIASQVIGR